MTGNNYEGTTIPMTNRDQAKAPKLGKFWCMSCDRCIVEIGSRCKACGVKCATGKRKK